LIIVETTVPPGTCEKVVKPIIQEHLKERGINPYSVYIAHSYERVMPGANYLDSIINFWRVYAGTTVEAADYCEAFLTKIINVKKLSSDEILQMLGINLNPTRLKCAILSLKTLQGAIQTYESNNLNNINKNNKHNTSNKNNNQ